MLFHQLTLRQMDYCFISLVCKEAIFYLFVYLRVVKQAEHASEGENLHRKRHVTHGCSWKKTGSAVTINSTHGQQQIPTLTTRRFIILPRLFLLKFYYFIFVNRCVIQRRHQIPCIILALPSWLLLGSLATTTAASKECM